MESPKVVSSIDTQVVVVGWCDSVGIESYSNEAVCEQVYNTHALIGLAEGNLKLPRLCWNLLWEIIAGELPKIGVLRKILPSENFT